MFFWTLYLSSGDWQQSQTSENEILRFKGSVYVDNSFVDGGTLFSLLSAAVDKGELDNALYGLNGFYSLVLQNQSELIAGVDHVRSRPLFYSMVDNHFYLSDNAEWVRAQVGDAEMALDAKEEFQLTGYVTGRDTLFPNVKQLQAGEYLTVREINGKIELSRKRYYRLLHSEPKSYDAQILLKQLDDSAVGAIGRLVDYAGGRQIVIPLSGGYDSRLIATLLKRLGYENVIAFTYGVPGNKESRYSEMVAELLAIKWHFVEYSEELWRDAWQSDQRWEYQKCGSGWSSIAHMQDWLAVRILEKDGVVEENCVFVPGHTGDFISGGHIPPAAFKSINFSPYDAELAILEKHYSLAPLALFENGKDFWLERVKRLIDDLPVRVGSDLANVCEKWEWQERQAKFICNSVRVYDFFGYCWWLPLWDRDFVAFWLTVPLSLRKGRRWYIDYVDKLFYNATGEKIDQGGKKSLLRLVYRKFSSAVSLFGGTNNGKGLGPQHLLWRARYPGAEVDNLLKSGYTSVGVNSYDLLQNINKYLSGDM